MFRNSGCHASHRRTCEPRPRNRYRLSGIEPAANQGSTTGWGCVGITVQMSRVRPGTCQTGPPPDSRPCLAALLLMIAAGMALGCLPATTLGNDRRQALPVGRRVGRPTRTGISTHPNHLVVAANHSRASSWAWCHVLAFLEGESGALAGPCG
jgi:hypothetical protein